MMIIAEITMMVTILPRLLKTYAPFAVMMVILKERMPSQHRHHEHGQNQRQHMSNLFHTAKLQDKTRLSIIHFPI